MVVIFALTLMVIVLRALPLIVIFFFTPVPDVLRSVFISWPSDTFGFSIALLVNISVGFVVVDAILFRWRKNTLLCRWWFGAHGVRLPEHKKEADQDCDNRPHQWHRHCQRWQIVF